MAGGAIERINRDTITLRLPGEPDLRGVAGLVLGGLAVRLNLTLESLQDLEIAVESLLERALAGEPATLELTVDEGTLAARVGPVDGPVVEAELADRKGPEMSLRRVLEAVADGHELLLRDGQTWLAVRKRIDPR